MKSDSLQVALITGGSRGIGRAVAIELGNAGFYCVINYKSNKQAAEETLSTITGNGADGEISAFDVTDRIATKSVIAELLDRLGYIDVLINNAGIVADSLFIMMKDEQWDSVIDTSLNGFYNVTKPVLKNMIKRKKGSIVTVSSVSALIGNRGQANYSAAKAAQIAATRSLATESARFNVRINAVAPGLIDTEMIDSAPVEYIKQMIPMNRIGRPEEVARVILFLCSDDASYITGQTIGINGGMI
ncbi:MAG: 3-oxoacyl-ACP reductase FabG [Spirochaetes bacterium]|jgi:3-oxoacyl-[acyl-carrier protein] reductase|nr:3-oxoacyl-ACP reductase FabG [Spirochaetota bacterium]